MMSRVSHATRAPRRKATARLPTVWILARKASTSARTSRQRARLAAPPSFLVLLRLAGGEGAGEPAGAASLSAAASLSLAAPFCSARPTVASMSFTSVPHCALLMASRTRPSSLALAVRENVLRKAAWKPNLPAGDQHYGRKDTSNLQ